MTMVNSKGCDFMTYNDYMKMELEELINTVLDSNGNVKACGRDACIAFMERLEESLNYPEGSLGDRDTGRLIVPAARGAVHMAYHLKLV